MKTFLLFLLLIKCPLFGATDPLFTRGYIGIYVNDRLEITGFDVSKNANEQGLLIGDRIIWLNGIRVKNRKECQSILSKTMKGDMIALSIKRNEVDLDIQFLLNAKFDEHTHVDKRPLSELMKNVDIQRQGEPN